MKRKWSCRREGEREGRRERDGKRGREREGGKGRERQMAVDRRFSGVCVRVCVCVCGSIY